MFFPGSTPWVQRKGERGRPRDGRFIHCSSFSPSYPSLPLDFLSLFPERVWRRSPGYQTANRLVAKGEAWPIRRRCYLWVIFLAAREAWFRSQCNFVYFCAAGCGKERLPAPFESLSFPAPYLLAHISTENYLKCTIQEDTVFIMCVYVKVGSWNTRMLTYIYLDTYAIWHGGLDWDIRNKMWFFLVSSHPHVRVAAGSHGEVWCGKRRQFTWAGGVARWSLPHPQPGTAAPGSAVAPPPTLWMAVGLGPWGD